MKIPSFEAFAEATDTDELNSIIIENTVKQLEEAGLELTEHDSAVMTAAIECSLSNAVTLLAAYHEWLCGQLAD